MSATVTFETPELTLRKACNEIGSISASDIVKAVVALVTAYDAASDFKPYKVREHLLIALQEEEEEE